MLRSSMQGLWLEHTEAGGPWCSRRWLIRSHIEVAGMQEVASGILVGVTVLP